MLKTDPNTPEKCGKKTRFLAYCYSSHAGVHGTNRVRARSNGEVSRSALRFCLLNVQLERHSGSPASPSPSAVRRWDLPHGSTVKVSAQDSQHFNHMAKVTVRTRNCRVPAAQDSAAL